VEDAIDSAESTTDSVEDAIDSMESTVDSMEDAIVSMESTIDSMEDALEFVPYSDVIAHANAVSTPSAAFSCYADVPRAAARRHPSVAITNTPKKATGPRYYRGPVLLNRGRKPSSVDARGFRPLH